MSVNTELVDRIYEASCVPELWTDVLQDLSNHFTSWGMALLCFDAERHARFVANERYREHVGRFFSIWPPIENVRPRRSLASGHAGFLSDRDVMTEEEIANDLVYRDYLRPYGLEHTAGSVIPVPSGDLIVFDLSRTPSQGPFQRMELEAMDAYRPHLARAAFVAHRFGMASVRAMTDALEVVGLPAATLTDSGRVLSANQGLIDMSPRITIGAHDRISIGRWVANGSGLSPHEARSIPMAANEAEPAAIVHLLPIRRAASDIFTGASVLLVVTKVAKPKEPMADLLSGLFDLTAAEVTVARGIAAGRTIDEIAQPRNTSRAASSRP